MSGVNFFLNEYNILEINKCGETVVTIDPFIPDYEVLERKKVSEFRYLQELHAHFDTVVSFEEYSEYLERLKPLYVAGWTEFGKIARAHVQYTRSELLDVIHIAVDIEGKMDEYAEVGLSTYSFHLREGMPEYIAHEMARAEIITYIDNEYQECVEQDLFLD